MPPLRRILITQVSTSRGYIQPDRSSLYGIQEDERIMWFWIGSHGDYDKLVKQLRKA